MPVKTFTTFIKSKTFMTILFVVVSVVAVAGVIYGVTTHKEPGFMTITAGWDRSQFPLQVCASAYVPSNAADAQSTTADAVSTINSRLGFKALEVSNAGRTCDIDVTVGVPTEVGFTEPGGNARISPKHVKVETANVHGELRDLVLEHELGHALGLAHDDYEQSIMRRTQSLPPDRELPPWISDSDKALLRASFGPK